MMYVKTQPRIRIDMQVYRNHHTKELKLIYQEEYADELFQWLEDNVSPVLHASDSEISSADWVIRIGYDTSAYISLSPNNQAIPGGSISGVWICFRDPNNATLFKLSDVKIKDPINKDWNYGDSAHKKAEKDYEDDDEDFDYDDCADVEYDDEYRAI